MNAPVLHYFSVMVLQLRALRGVEFSCQGGVPACQSPNSMYQDPPRERSVCREQGEACPNRSSAHGGDAVEASHQGAKQKWFPS